MKNGFGRLMWAGVACMMAVAVPRADTLVMRDGRRVDGTLVEVRDGVIEFEGRRGFFGGRERIRVNRADVSRIELDEAGDRRDDGDDRDDSRRGGRPAGLREREVGVDAARAWTDTGIDVRAGQTVYFSARGKVQWGPGRQDDAGGEGGSHYNPNRPIPGRPGAALIGRVGERDEPFFIGSDEGPIRMRASGRLYLGINDDYLRDNAGALRVTVYF
jgi:hypothetical protein